MVIQKVINNNVICVKLCTIPSRVRRLVNLAPQSKVANAT